MTQRLATPLPEASLRRVVELVLAHHCEPLQVGDLADAAGYSPFHFTRLFRQQLGITPGQYLVAHRVETAKRLLLHDDAAVVDVATGVGFDSLSSFTRRFRATVGVPPGQLRRLVEQVADRPPRPFDLPGPGQQRVQVSLHLPPRMLAGGTPQVWVGWYPQPAAIGLPTAGLLAEYGQPVSLPLSPGSPWLLGFAVPAGSQPVDQLAPDQPVVAVHPRPVVAGGRVALEFRGAPFASAPLLSALPSLCRRG